MEQGTYEQRGAAEMLNRGTAVQSTNTGSTIVVADGKNSVSIPGFPYEFEAFGDKILVAVDIFKSGFECKECGGSGRIKWNCPCESTDRPGYRYSKDQIKEFETTINSNVAKARSCQVCPTCEGNYKGARVDKECPACKGIGSTIIVPDSSKTLPTTGVIVSVGDDVKSSRVKNGERVLYGAYSGTMVPTKVVGVSFKFLREHEILGFIQHGEELGAFDFVLPQKES